MVKSIITRGEKTSFEIRYFISSITDADEFAHAVREHWAIENKLHWSLDVIFREDSDKAKKDNAPLNLNILDKTALYSVSQFDLGKITRNRKRYKAPLNPDVLKAVIFSPKYMRSPCGEQVCACHGLVDETVDSKRFAVSHFIGKPKASKHRRSHPPFPRKKLSAPLTLQPVLEEDSKLSHYYSPVLDRHTPFFGDFHNRQIH
jgi:hypothetical protein